MPKFLILFLFVYMFFANNFYVLASTSRIYDFNDTSDLTNFFNDDGDGHSSNINYGGLGLSGSVDISSGYEDIWTSKTGYIPTGIGDIFEISGYFRNLDIYGYGSVGFSKNNVNLGDGLSRATPSSGIGLVFHGGGGYFVSDGNYEEIIWPPDLEDNTWYKFTFIVENIGGDKFNVIAILYKADEFGSLISFKSINYFEVTNSDLASATKIYSYFGNASPRFTNVDNIKIYLTNATFEEEGNPAVTTTTILNISKTSADGGGNVTSAMGNSVTARGVCYGTSSNPTTSGTCTSDGTGLGTFNSNITGLNSGTTYYYRAYATNANGTSYGSQSTFTTTSDPTQIGSNNKFSENKKCTNLKPSPTTWILMTPAQKNGIKGMLVYWSQQQADKITILIDNGTNKFPFKINKTKNDGKEFIANLTSKQKIKLIPFNGCKEGDESPAISTNQFPKGYFRNTNKK